MKRTGGLERRTPMAPGKPLARSAIIAPRKTGLSGAMGNALGRRTPLQQGGKPLERGAVQPPRRRQRVKPQSAKRALDADLRRALVAALLAERPVCEARWACRGAKAVDVHERLKRSRGGKITDPIQAHMVTLCRACHELTEAEPAEATRRRMLLPSWHRCPPVGPC